MRLPASLHARLVLSHLLVASASIILIIIFAGSAIFNSTYEEATSRLEDLASVTSNSLERPLQDLSAGSGDIQAVKNAVTRLLANRPELSYTIYKPDGSPMLDSGETLPPVADENTAPEVWEALQGELGESRQIRRNAQGDQMLYVAARIQRENVVYGILQLGTPLRPVLDSARRSLGLLLLTAVLVIVLVGVYGWVLANNLARPIQRLTETAERLSRGDLGARVKPSGTQELHRLALSFNFMADRLKDHVDELRAFVANASHELRTPLTVVKLRAEALRDGAMEDPAVAQQFLAEVESEVDRLVCMVNDLLDLSRMEAGLVTAQRTQINLEVVASEVFETFKIRASRAGVRLELDIEPELPAIFGVEDQLRRVLYNFIDNAIKYTPQGGQVCLVLRSGRQNKTLRLMVTDTGQGIAPGHLTHIFERFYRAEATRPRYGMSKGSGLGLAIAKTIIENHDGKIGVSSQVGQGTTFWAELPVHG